LGVVLNDDPKGITVKKTENFSEWYTQVIIKSEFIDYTEVSGSIAFRPSAYFAWESIMKFVDYCFKKDGVENVYFPMLIPEKFLRKEEEHFKGFNVEVAWVTGAGNTTFSERLGIRPTSETIMYPSFSKWIRSWRDLPMRYNQWNTVLRWEFKNPTPFIRSREFIWNEGHSVFANREEAESERNFVIETYLKVLKEKLALAGIPGRKTESEKFAGAEASFSIELLMPDGWALQGPDFHLDGQNFAKAFDIKFLNKDGKIEYAWQNTYAISTRMLGVMVAVHGDDKGLVLPPEIANIQIIIIPIINKGDDESVIKAANEIYRLLKENYRIKIDADDSYSVGFKFNKWELKGVPIRIEIGPRDITKESVIVVRRDTGEKISVGMKELNEKLGKILTEIQNSMYEKSLKFLRDNTHIASNYDDFLEVLKIKGGIIQAPWCGDAFCEEKIKNETGAKITNMPFEHHKLLDKCIYCGKKARYMANFAKSY
jgi:prolyl-tRNA synthetase